MSATPSRHSSSDENDPEGRVRSLPLQSWPEADRKAWQEACQPSVRLRRGGSASHLCAVSRNDLTRRYGLFLEFLSSSGQLAADLKPAASVTPETVSSYVREVKERVSSVTVYGSISKLHRVARLIAPDQDFRWLRELEGELRYEMRPRSKAERLVLSETLVQAGLTLMTQAETAPNLTKLAQARLFRNGLMIVLLAYHPIRLKNFAALEIGRTLVSIKGNWWIVLPASETKERRADERRVSPLIGPALDSYVRLYRPILRRGRLAHEALWVESQFGGPMACASVGETITETTRSTVGVPVTPHLFRMSTASTAAIYAPQLPHLASALLHHSDTRITEEHYNRATSVSAAQAYAAITDKYRRQ
jgi:integrase